MTKAKYKRSKPKTPAAKPPEKERVMDQRGHKIGSRKGKVHAVFDEQDEATAFTLGQKLKLKDGTLRSWFMVWRRVSKPTKAAKAPRPVTKPTDKVEATAAAAH